MKLYRFEIDGAARIGVERGDSLIDVTDAAKGCMLSVIENAVTAIPAIEQALQGDLPAYAIASVRLLAPIERPGKVLCSGINYHGHFAENPKAVMPSSPFFFAKLPNTIAGPGDPIFKPALTEQLDYEVEFAVVIGKRIRNAASAEALEAIFGYTILHDVSARDVQFTDYQITLGKNFDNFAPIGPCIVTVDEIPDTSDVRLKTTVNGVVLQNGSTQDWVFPLGELIACLSHVMTLNPGDIVTTGTPAGVGYFQNPQVFLQDGDVVSLEVEGIGVLTNRVTLENAHVSAA